MNEVEKQNREDRLRNLILENSQDSNFEEPVKIKDKEIFKSNLIGLVKNTVEDYLKTNEDKQLAMMRISNDPQLDLYIARGSKQTEQGNHLCNALHFYIKAPGTDKNIAEFGLRDYGDEFRLSHRKVDPKYRGNGIATITFEAIEEFVKEYCRKVPGREPVIEANAAQLDVMKLFTSAGYQTVMSNFKRRPGEADFKIHNMDDVLLSLENKDGDYRVGRYLYVFPSSYKGSDFKGNGSEPEDINIDESALVHFRKRLDVESGEEERSKIIKDIGEKTDKVLGQ